MLKQSINLVPARRDLYQAKLVFYLFIASLTMFFIGSLITYCVIRTESFRTLQYSYDAATATFVPSTLTYEPLRLPVSFWLSTALLVGIGIFPVSYTHLTLPTILLV